MLRHLTGLTSLGIICCSAFGAPSIQYVESGYLICSLSRDGTTGAGNVVGDASYETFRWTRTGGTQRLGLATYQTIGRAAGTPNVSNNGRRVSASILSSDMQLTQGLWDIDTGWSETMPESPEGGALVDDGYGSAWGLSGNGLVLTGFFWSEDYRAHASAWSAANGVIALGQTAGRSARANAANYDGSVAGGWEENSWGSWMPRAWRNGIKYELNNDDGGVNMVECINSSGSILAGSCRDDSVEFNVATLWRWNGTSYNTDRIGSLGGLANQSTVTFTGISDDGKLGAGMNGYTWDYTEGFVWTPETGMASASAFFALIGVQLPESFYVLDCAAVSADGSTIAATVTDTETYDVFTAIIRLREPCPGDVNNDGMVDDSDFVGFAAAYDVLDCADPTMPGYCSADLNKDAFVDDADFVAFAQAYDQLLCP